MNKFVFSALATTLVGATSFASDTEWPALDSELAALNNAPLTQDSSGPFFSGWLINSLRWNSDAETVGATGTANTDQGFGLNAARVNLSGSVGSNYGYVIGFDFADAGERFVGSAAGSGTAGITDAYGTFAIGEQVNGKFGVFNMPFLRSSGLQRNHTLFLSRSFLGGMYSSRDAGVAFSGQFSRVNWEFAIQNGFDGTGEGWAWGGRVDLDVMGTSSNVEGGYNSAEGTNLNVGIGINDDTSDATLGGASRDAFEWGIDATLTSNGFTVFAEMVDQDKGIFGPDGRTPWSGGLAYLFGENYEAAFRYDDFDTTDNDTRMTLGVNRYINGHDAKWQLAFSTGSTDRTGANDPQEDTIITLGLALGF